MTSTSGPNSVPSPVGSSAALSSVRSNFQRLGTRLQEENEARDRERGLNLDFTRSRDGSGRRQKPFMSILPGRSDEMSPRRTPLELSPSPLRHINPSEIESKMKEIYRLTGILTIDGARYNASPEDLQHIGELGTGSCGHVVKMVHKPTGKVMAVKQMRRSGNTEENKRITMDLDVVLKSHDCPYIVQCLGCFITDADVWICMELMSTCLDKLLKKLNNKPIPEPILGKITVATVKALHYLKDVHNVIHRDVKPSNILLEQSGQVKLCDFGISGRLVDSKAKTRTAGSAAYMAPERIEPPDPTRPDYDIRADVWSLGITLVELATGVLPYSDCRSEFEALTKVLKDDPPSLPDGRGFSPEFRGFVDKCLTKNFKRRPKYKKLLEHDFIRRSERMRVDVAAWFRDVQAQTSGIKTPTTRRRTPPPPSPHHAFLTRRRTPEPERYNSSSMVSPLLLRRQEPYRSNGPSSLPTTSSCSSAGQTPGGAGAAQLTSAGRPPMNPAGRGFYTPEPHRRPFPHQSFQSMYSQP